MEAAPGQYDPLALLPPTPSNSKGLVRTRTFPKGHWYGISPSTFNYRGALSFILCISVAYVFVVVGRQLKKMRRVWQLRYKKAWPLASVLVSSCVSL